MSQGGHNAPFNCPSQNGAFLSGGLFVITVQLNSRPLPTGQSTMRKGVERFLKFSAPSRGKCVGSGAIQESILLSGEQPLVLPRHSGVQDEVWKSARTFEDSAGPANGRRQPCHLAHLLPALVRSLLSALHLPACPECDRPVLWGELHGVAQEIEEGLFQPNCVGMEGRQVALDHGAEGLGLLLGEALCDHDDILQGPRHWYEFGPKLKPALFHLGEIQDIVDELVRVPAARMNMAIYLSCLSVRGPMSGCCKCWEKPMIEFKGVLSSWDMLTRNSDSY